MERTKKMPDSISFGAVQAKQSEFLVPSPTENGKLIGIKSGNVYIYGMICYIGIEIFSCNIIDKMKAHKITIPDEEAYQIVLARFIDELYRYKIGNVITSDLDSQGNIVLIKVSESERKPQQIAVKNTDLIHNHGKDGIDGKEYQKDYSSPGLSKEEKKALKKKWKAAQNRKYILNKTKVQKLFHYLEVQLAVTPCDNTLHFTEQWLEDNLTQENIENVIAEIKDMGGYCDCEVLFNCYEKYNIG